MEHVETSKKIAMIFILQPIEPLASNRTLDQIKFFAVFQIQSTSIAKDCMKHLFRIYLSKSNLQEFY